MALVNHPNSLVLPTFTDKETKDIRAAWKVSDSLWTPGPACLLLLEGQVVCVSPPILVTGLPPFSPILVTGLYSEGNDHFVFPYLGLLK